MDKIDFNYVCDGLTLEEMFSLLESNSFSKDEEFELKNTIYLKSLEVCLVYVTYSIIVKEYLKTIREVLGETKK